jgi:hypothetical protein
MTLAAFLEHWSLVEHPFKGEEARQDPVFARLASLPEPGVGTRAVAGLPKPGSRVQHPDFEKIVGEFNRPGAGVVFGEKGSGKTAMRLQLAEHVAAHNAANPDRRVLLIGYDNLNEMLDRFHARVLPTMRDKKAGPAETLKQVRLSDHIDGILALAVPRVVDAVLEQPPRPVEPAGQVDLGPLRTFAGGPKRAVRSMDTGWKRDILLLQAVYDRPVGAAERTLQLRRRLGIRRPWIGYIELALASLGWLVPLSVAAVFYYRVLPVTAGSAPIGPLPGGGAGSAGGGVVGPGPSWSELGDARAILNDPVWATALFVSFGLWLAMLVKKAITDRFFLGRMARRLRRSVRVIDREDGDWAESLRELPAAIRTGQTLPLTKSEDRRYAMLERLRRVLGRCGYSGLVVVIDRVDEPTLVSGDADRMRSVVWPLMNNKFLQQDGVGVKMLLPIELKHLLFRESAAFFQEARLDKQNFVERLGWTGAMLYDLCTARLNACRPAGSSPLNLLDLFAEDVTRADLVDGLDQMHHPRDAFKFLYQCIAEHCSNATSENASFRVPKAVLDMVRKQQAERIRQLYMGVRPA